MTYWSQQGWIGAFTSTSGCRDLLFHYHEHRYTLGRLRSELNELGLAFIGFRGFKDVTVGDRYRRHFPHDGAMNDLNCWEQFEEMYPDTFGGMYHFWCQKA